MEDGRAIRRQDQAAVRHAREGLDGALDVGGVLDGAGHKLDRERRRQRPRPTAGSNHKAVVLGLATRAARARRGAISLSIASHLPVMLAS